MEASECPTLNYLPSSPFRWCCRTPERWSTARCELWSPLRARADGSTLSAGAPRGFCVQRHRLRVDDDRIVALGELDAREAVQHVGEHQARIALDRIAVAAGVRHRDLKRLASLQAEGGHLRRPMLLVRPTGVLHERRVEPIVPAEDTPR